MPLRDFGAHLRQRDGLEVQVALQGQPAPVPALLRLPNTRLVAVAGPSGVLRVEEEPAGRPKLGAEASVRRLLNEWDPIGTADVVEDEYDGYISGVLGLLRSGASVEGIARHLLGIERGMGLDRTPMDRLLSISARHRELSMPKR